MERKKGCKESLPDKEGQESGQEKMPDTGAQENGREKDAGAQENDQRKMPDAEEPDWEEMPDAEEPEGCGAYLPDVIQGSGKAGGGQGAPQEPVRGKPPDRAESDSAQAAVNRFTKEQLLSSARFRERRDLLEALLSGEGRYSIAETEQEMEKYRKGKVK